MFRVLIVPVGAQAVGPWIERLMNHLAETFRLQVELARPLPYPAPAFNPHRRRFFANLMADHLRELDRRADFILGLTDVDLYSVQHASVISECHPGARSAVISVVRLKDFLFGERPEELFFKRLCKEAVRVLGQMVGMGSCPDPRCVMFPARSLMETDFKSLGFCPECQTRLRLRFGFAPPSRKAA